jgi:hypothetical protein
MFNSTRGIDAGRGVIRHQGVSDGCAEARPLWRSQSAQMEMFFADVSFRSIWSNLDVFYDVHLRTS